MIGRIAPAAQVPPDTLAWWRFDPSRFASVQNHQQGRELFIAALRSAASGGLGGETAGRVIEGLLAASEIGAAEHIIALLEMRAHRPASGSGAEFDALQMVLHIETDRGHDRLLRTIKTILVDSPDARGDDEDGPPSQRTLELPGDRHAVAFTRKNWGPARTISWCSTDTAFIVGLGEGALQRWFQPSAQPDAEWTPHTRAVDLARPAGPTFLEAYMNIRAMRDRFPAAFTSGRTPRLRTALGLDHADSCMVHGRFVENTSVPGAPPLIALDLTVSRADDLEHRMLSEHAWPSDQTCITPPPGSFTAVINADWARLYSLALALYESTIQDPDLPEFVDARERWERDNAQALDTLFASLSRWIVLSDIPPPIVPVPGLCTVFIESRDGVTHQQIATRLERTLSAFDGVITSGNNSEYWLRLDDRGLIRLPAWGIARRENHAAIIGSWATAAVRAAAKWYEQSPTPDTDNSSDPSPTP